MSDWRNGRMSKKPGVFYSNETATDCSKQILLQNSPKKTQQRKQIWSRDRPDCGAPTALGALASGYCTQTHHEIYSRVKPPLFILLKQFINNKCSLFK